jgi:hypothetical protein
MDLSSRPLRVVTGLLRFGGEIGTEFRIMPEGTSAKTGGIGSSAHRGKPTVEDLEITPRGFIATALCSHSMTS